jgi:uncharacterized membrane protein
MTYLRIGAILVGCFLVGWGLYILFYNNLSFAVQEQTVNIHSIESTGIPSIYGALLVVAGATLIVLQLVLNNKKK